jgi:hypothetical protein
VEVGDGRAQWSLSTGSHAHQKVLGRLARTMESSFFVLWRDLAGTQASREDPEEATTVAVRVSLASLPWPPPVPLPGLSKRSHPGAAAAAASLLNPARLHLIREREPAVLVCVVLHSVLDAQDP